MIDTVSIDVAQLEQGIDKNHQCDTLFKYYDEGILLAFGLPKAILYLAHLLVKSDYYI